MTYDLIHSVNITIKQNYFEITVKYFPKIIVLLWGVL